MQRRHFLRLSGAAALVAAPAAAQQGGRAGITPNEDLMQEHGLVGRVFLIYRRAARMLRHGPPLEPGLVGDAAQVVARVIHGHHEVEEEEILFPVVEKQAGLGDMVRVLREQHLAARELTAAIGNNLTPARLREPRRVDELVSAMSRFETMYEAHGNYENTVIYPSFRRAVGAERYAELAQRFAEDERKLHGPDGFLETAARLDEIESRLGIRLAAFTRQAAS